MSKRTVVAPNYKGLTVNERLAVSGQLDVFGAAAKNGNRRKMQQFSFWAQTFDFASGF